MKSTGGSSPSDRRVVPIRPRLGIHCTGTGTGGPWRYVHSILAGLDPDEFDVTVFCDLPGGYEPRPWVNVVRLSDAADRPAPQPAPTAAAATPATSRGLAPKWLRVWTGFLKEARRLARLLQQHPVDLFHTQST